MEFLSDQGEYEKVSSAQAVEKPGISQKRFIDCSSC